MSRGDRCAPPARSSTSANASAAKKSAPCCSRWRRSCPARSVAKRLSGTINPEELVTSVERRTAAALPAEAVATIYWDTDREAYRLISQHGFAPAVAGAAHGMPFPLGARFGGRLAAGETLAVNQPDAWGGRERALLARFRIG